MYSTLHDLRESKGRCVDYVHFLVRLARACSGSIDHVRYVQLAVSLYISTRTRPAEDKESPHLGDPERTDLVVRLPFALITLVHFTQISIG
jgi:hypothetical protein